MSMDAEKAFDRIQDVFIIKTLNEMGIAAPCVSKIKAIYDKPKAIIILSGKKLKSFPLRSETR